MIFANEKITVLAQDYAAWEKIKEIQEARRKALSGQIFELQEAELTGQPDPVALAGVRAELQEVGEKIEAATRRLERVDKELAGVLAAAVGERAKDLPGLKAEADRRRLAAAQALGAALAVLRFYQGPKGVFGPDELIAATVGPLAGRKSEPGYYPEVLAALEAAAGQEEARLREEYPEGFRELTGQIRFLEAWAGPPAQTAKTPAEWKPSQTISAIQNREAHLRNLVAATIAQARKGA
jgi:hypothetical protein